MTVIVLWVLGHTGLISTVASGLFVASEGLAQIDGVKSNSIFQLVTNILKKISGK